MDFRNMGYGRLNITDSFYFIINDTVISIWIVGALLIGLAVVFRIKFKKFTPVPTTRFQNIMEVLVDFFSGLTNQTLTPKYANFSKWFFGVFLFIIFSNLSGLFGLRPPTADITVTLTLGIATVVMMIYAGLRYNTKGYLKGFLAPFPLFLPMNIVGEVSKAFSLGMRLFGNLLAGVIISAMLGFMLPWWLQLGPPGVLSIYFDLFVGVLQAYVFVILSMTFISLSTPQED